MSESPYEINLKEYLIANKNDVNTFEVDRSEILSIQAKYNTDYSQFDTDMIIEFSKELEEVGFDMNRVNDIEIIKEFNLENKLIFVQD